MQLVRTTITAGLFLLLGTAVPAYEQQNQQREKQAKPERRQEQQQQGSQARGQEQQRQSQGQQQRVQQTQQQPRDQRQRVQQSQQQPRDQRGREQRSQQVYQQRQQQRTQQQAVEWQQQRGWARQGAWQGNTTWQQGRARRWDQEHRTWAQRGGYGGYYIPQARFSLYFGSQHWFRIQTRPVMYMGYPRFDYRGYSFLLLDPWPEYWEEQWYAADDVYVDYDDYDDGYYLHNRRHPNVRLAISIVL